MSVSYRERKLSKVLNLLKGEREKKFFLSLYHSLPAVSKKYMKDIKTKNLILWVMVFLVSFLHKKMLSKTFT